jgi:hypothetical protein
LKLIDCLAGNVHAHRKVVFLRSAGKKFRDVFTLRRKKIESLLRLVGLALRLVSSDNSSRPGERKKKKERERERERERKRERERSLLLRRA